MKIEIQTSRFQFNHGRKPRGFGRWAFDIAGELFFFTGLYGEACKAAKRVAHTRDARIIVLGA